MEALPWGALLAFLRLPDRLSLSTTSKRLREATRSTPWPDIDLTDGALVPALSRPDLRAAAASFLARHLLGGARRVALGAPRTHMTAVWGRYVDGAFLRACGLHTATLTSLRLSGCPALSDDDLLDLAPACTALTELSLSRCRNVGPAVATLLSSTLTALDLTCTAAGDDVLEAAVSTCPHLAHLQLASTALTSGGAALLAGFTSLVSLDVSGLRCVADDHLAAALSANPGLQGVVVTSNKGLSTAVSSVLADAASNTALTELHFAGCGGLAPQLSSWVGRRTLAHVDLRHVAVTMEHLTALAAVSTALSSLCLSSDEVIDGGVASLCAAAPLRRLSLQACPVGDATVSIFPHTLVDVCVRRCKALTLDGVNSILALPGLQAVDVAETLGGEEVVPGWGLNLSRVTADRCKWLTGRSLGALAAASAGLTTVSLVACVNLTNDGVHALLAAAPHLRMLDVRGCRGLTHNAWCTPDVVCRRLSVIDMGGTQPSEASFQALCGTHRLPLTEVCAWGARCLDDSALGALASCTTLTRLDLEDCPVTAAAVGGLLRAVTRLQCLRLSIFDMDADAVGSLVVAFPDVVFDEG